jgi:DNA modification methylase
LYLLKRLEDMKLGGKTKTLFPNIQLIGSDKPIILNKAKLLEIIQGIAKEKAINKIRESVFDLERQLKDVKADTKGLFNISENGDTIKLNQRYLFNELNQIMETHTLERGRYYLGRLAKAISEYRTNKINDINLNLWKEYIDIITDSLWILDKRDSSGVHTAGYWGNFIPQIPNQMLKRYTKKGEWVLDPFVGCGTTLIESQRLGRNGIGVELQEAVAQKAREFISFEPNKYGVVSQVVNGDSTDIDFGALLARYNRKTVQLIIMHPPYFDIIKFSKDPRDLSNARSADDFLGKMNKVVEHASKFLDRGRYLALVIGDKYSKGEWVPLGFLTMQEVLKKGFSLKSIIVKNFEETLGKRNQKELWRYRALVGGFYIFKHEYIFLFKKK